MKEIIRVLKQFGDMVLNQTLEKLKSQGVEFVMPAFYPQRGSVLQDYTKIGGKASIAGGLKGQQLFESITQYGLPFETTGIEETPENLEKIVKALPQDKHGPIALFIEASLGKLWSEATKKHLTDVKIVATNEQDLRSYFEEKINLASILKKAGLEKYIIPQEIVHFPMNSSDIEGVYSSLMNNDGKVVIQNCGPGVNESGGGHSTTIINSFEEFAEYCTKQSSGFAKIATYIDGLNSNLSFCVGNLVPNKAGLGATKCSLQPGDSCYLPETIDSLLEQGKQCGLTPDNIFTIVVPSTLKVVGDPLLTMNPTSGVGNIINYHFNNGISEEIYNIGNKLGTLLGLCGKVGLAGVDLIITKEGHIYINEINDRQQGTTETTSVNCENNNIPGIHHIAFLQNFADLKDPNVSKYMQGLKDNAKTIFESSAEAGSPFYIKINGTHDGVKSKVDLSSGVYQVTKDLETGSWKWDFTPKEQGFEQEPININSNSLTFEITGMDLKQGVSIAPGAQIGRFCGIAEPGSEPFLIDVEGHSVLNPDYIPVVCSFFAQTQVQDANQTQMPENGLDDPSANL